MLRMRMLAILVVVTACTPAAHEPGPALPAPAGDVTPEASPDAGETGGSAPPTPALVLIGVAVGIGLMVALLSNTTMMPDTAP